VYLKTDLMQGIGYALLVHCGVNFVLCHCRFGIVTDVVLDKPDHKALISFQAVDQAISAVNEIKSRSFMGRKMMVSELFYSPHPTSLECHGTMKLTLISAYSSIGGFC